MGGSASRRARLCVCCCSLVATRAPAPPLDAAGSAPPTELDGHLAELAGAGLAAFGATRELVRTCGDENPPLEFLLHPEWLPDGRTRRLLQAGLPPDADAALGTFASAVSIFRGHAHNTWRIAVEYAHSCFVRRACAGNGLAAAEIRAAQEAFLAAIAPFLGQIAKTGGGSRWIRSIGAPPHIIARHAFSADHADFAASLVSGLGAIEPDAAVGMLHDLSLRVAFSSCAMLAHLLAHFTIAELRGASAPAIGSPAFPPFEFHGSACCRRYHVLAELIRSLASRQGRASLRMAEVGVNNAITSEFLLARFPDLAFDGVDPYIGAAAIHAEAQGRLARFGARARLWHATSEAAASRFAEGSFDLVFVDGDHSREAVVADLRAWRPRVRPGGLLAGHDLFNPAFDGVLDALFIHLNVTPGGESRFGAVETIHFGPDFVWWLHV